MALTQVSTQGIKDGTILNADINASAAIAGTKISSDFGSQNIVTNGRLLLGTTTEGHADADDLTIETSSGYAGITLRSPSDAGGAIYFSDATSGAGEYDGQILYSQSSRTMQLITANNPRLTLDSSGNLLSGTTSSSLLSNFNANAGGLILDDIGSGATAFLATHGDKQIFLGNDTSANYLWGYSNHDLLFGTNNQPRMTINSSGNIAIGGSSNVGTKLHIENPSGDAHIRLRGSANYGILFTRHSDAALTGYVGSGNAVNLGGSNVAVSATLSGGDIIFQTNGTAATDEKMRIASDGLVTVKGDLAVTSSLAKIKLNDTDGGDQYQIRNDAGTFIIRNGTDSKSVLTIDGACVTSILNATPPGSGVSVLHVSDSGSATTLGTAATFRVSNNGGNSAYSVFEAESGSGSIRLANDGQFYVTGASTFNGDIRVDRGTAGIDGIVGQAYSGYFGLKHADQTINSEYMILNNNTSTFISCSSGYSIYIRPSANSQVHETVFAHDTTTFNTHLLINDHNIQRNDFSAGFLVGAQNNQGASDAKTNPIFTIGTSHRPTNTALSDMYGIGFSHGNASFTPSGVGWGLYVAADGDARVYLDASNARIYFDSNLVSTPRFISSVSGEYGSLQINNGQKNGWGGFSIDGHSVFMSNGSATGDYLGLYDDNANKWHLLSQRNAWLRLYHNSNVRLETTTAGVYITGTLTASSTKSFRIPHPLSELSETKDLVHAAIEGPQMDLMYRGKVDLVNGTATVNIDTKSGMTEGTFDVLNRDVQCFTTNETGWTNVKGSVTGNKLTIVAEDNSCTDTISWMVIGERKDNDVVSSEVTNDNGDLIVEPDKQIISEDPKMDD